MKKVLLRLSMVIVTLVLISQNVICAYAVGNTRKFSAKPTTGVESPISNTGTGYVKGTAPIVNQVEGMFQAASSSAYIYSGECSISQISSGYVRCYAESIASLVVDKLGYNASLQKWDGYDWTTIAIFNNEGYNIPVINGYHYKSVTPNFDYRVEVCHYLTDGGVSDYEVSTSNYIYVN
jgi:hypothetical protein